jgi:hypothetical protein
MKRFATIIAGLLMLAAFAATASAALRVPQVAFASGSLQAYFNGVGESINVLTDQEDVQRWASTVSNNSTFTIQVELAGNAPLNTFGLYNAGLVAPPLYQVFPGGAGAGWFAVASFRTGPTRVVVNLFDNTAAFVGTTTYLGADRNDFGFYLQGPGGTFYTQDARNPGGLPQALTYAGTGLNSGQWWLCFEDLDMTAFPPGDYDDGVLFLESVNPTPVNKSSWGELKARFK